MNQQSKRAGQYLPPDPDGMNEKRAEWASAALRTFRRFTGADERDAVSDLITDLFHWCDRHGQRFGRELERAICHYEAETERIV